MSVKVARLTDFARGDRRTPLMAWLARSPARSCRTATARSKTRPNRR